MDAEFHSFDSAWPTLLALATQYQASSPSAALAVSRSKRIAVRPRWQMQKGAKPPVVILLWHDEQLVGGAVTQVDHRMSFQVTAWIALDWPDLDITQADLHHALMMTIVDGIGGCDDVTFCLPNSRRLASVCPLHCALREHQHATDRSEREDEIYVITSDDATSLSQKLRQIIAALSANRQIA